MPKQYRVLIVLTMAALLAACGAPTPTPIPFAQYTAEDVLAAFVGAGLTAGNIREELSVGRDAPLTFSDRRTFEIASIAPDGGQILVFNNPDGLAAWQTYIAGLQSDSTTRRDVVYTYVKGNILVQLNAGLLPDEARRYREALEGM
jgi:hypothetical protein